MRTLRVAVLVIVGMTVLTGCPKKQPIVDKPNYSRELAPGELALRKITDPSKIPDFTQACSDTNGLKESIARSLNYFSKASSMKAYPYGEITHAQAIASLKEFSAMLDQRLSPAQLNAAIREKFDVYESIGWDDKGTVLFTGYYTPIFDASPTKAGAFQYPIYRQPPNLVKDADGKVLGMKQPDGSLVPCPDRKTIETTNVFSGLELYYLQDAFSVYLAQLQGSAILRMADGRYVTAGYAAYNGLEYRSMAMEMINDGKIKKEDLSMQTVMAYCKAHPEEVAEYAHRNPRFVFFAPGNGMPRGCLNEPVTRFRTIATDKSVFPRGCLAMVDTVLTSGGQDMSYKGFALDQDAGGAIRAAGRCDIYMGVGDQAAEVAGRANKEGRLYYIFLKPQAITPPDLSPVAIDAAADVPAAQAAQ